MVGPSLRGWYKTATSLQEGEEVTYMSGGAGYVLSRAALARLQAPHAPARCRPPGQTTFEDVNMGYCMAALGGWTSNTKHTC